jgi:hypothetical protein
MVKAFNSFSLTFYTPLALEGSVVDFGESEICV